MAHAIVPSWAEDLAETFMRTLGTRWDHVRGVTVVAKELSASIDDPDESLVSAALLHDIGYSVELRLTGMHAIDGALHLESIQAPPQVVSLVAFHTGAEYEADERGLAHELARFERPRQEVLDALILADLTVGPDGDQVSVSERLDEIFDRYPPAHAVHRAVAQSRRYLESCAGRAAQPSNQPM